MGMELCKLVDLNLYAVRRKLEVKTTKLGKTQNVLAT